MRETKFISSSVDISCYIKYYDGKYMHNEYVYYGRVYLHVEGKGFIF